MSSVSDQIRELLSALKHAPPVNNFQEHRENIEAMVDPTDVPPGMTAEKVVAGGLPAEWVSTPGASNHHVILYLHGGAYVYGSCNTHRGLAARLSAASGARTLVVEYRLAPEDRFPAAIEDAVGAYRWLIENNFKPENIIISGDSAGGGLTMATLLSLREAGDPLPAGAALISPWTDLAATGDSVVSRADVDPWINADRLIPQATVYLGDADPRNPLASPLYADLKGLPPLLIQVGNDEILLDDSTRLARRAEEAGVKVDLEVWEGMWHVRHIFAGMLPEAQQAIDKMGQFVRSQIGLVQAGV